MPSVSFVAERFQWASANADKLRDIIKQAEKMKADLDKMDSRSATKETLATSKNIAQMYAKKCKKDPADLLALMKKGGWLTAQEALDWGFVDEITDFEDDAAPVIDDRMAADMGAAGIPIPTSVEREPSGNMFSRLIDALTTAFHNIGNTTNTKADMNTVTQTPAPQQQETPATAHAPAATPSASVPAPPPAEDPAHAAALAAKDAEINRLKAEIEALKKAPGDNTSHLPPPTQQRLSLSDEGDACYCKNFEPNSLRCIYTRTSDELALCYGFAYLMVMN